MLDPYNPTYVQLARPYETDAHLLSDIFYSQIKIRAQNAR